MGAAGYPMNNTHPSSGDHHTALAELLDPGTTRRLTELGEENWAGAWCLEVGAGAGSIARWLADRVDVFGMVTATDLDPSRIPTHPRLRAVQHDLCGTAPIVGGPFDLIHARLVLGHLPTRDTILTRLVNLLAPGGTILIEDWATLRTRDDVIITAPDDAAAALYAEYQHTIGAHVFDPAGTDRTWARRIHPAMLANGLTNVHTEVRAESWTGGGAGTRAVAAVLHQVRPTLRRFMADDRLDTVLDLLDDPRLVIHGHPMYAVSGRLRAEKT
jgi:2-polyprenyl-3-methyl-5-hydroxy-6-metoxy-1,4-benzoquinol methylase